MFNCTIETIQQSNTVPMARVRPMASIIVNLNNNTEVPAIFVLFTEKLINQEWIPCLAVKQRKIKCVRAIQPALQGHENFMNDLVIHFNKVDAKNYKALIKGSVTIRSVLLPYDTTYYSAVVVCLDSISSIENLRFTLNISKKSQGAQLFRIRCIEVTTGITFVSQVFGLNNGHTKEETITNSIPELLRTKGWPFISSELNSFKSIDGLQFAKNFTYSCTITVQEFSTFKNADFFIQLLPLQKNSITQVGTLKRPREDFEIVEDLSAPVTNEQVITKKVKLFNDDTEAEDISVFLFDTPLPYHSLLD
jgi:hypothetical protein